MQIVFSSVIFFTLHLRTNRYFLCSLDPLCLSHLIHPVFLTYDSVSLSSSLSSIRIVLLPPHGSLYDLSCFSLLHYSISLVFTRTILENFAPSGNSLQQEINAGFDSPTQSVLPGGEVSFDRGEPVSGGGLVSGNDKDKRWQHDRREERRAGERRTMHPSVGHRRWEEARFIDSWGLIVKLLTISIENTFSTSSTCFRAIMNLFRREYIYVFYIILFWFKNK